MTVENGKVKYQIINAYFTFNASHPSLHRCRHFQQRELIATALIHSRIDNCNSLFLNVLSYQLYISTDALIKPSFPSSTQLHLLQTRQMAVHKERPE